MMSDEQERQTSILDILSGDSYIGPADRCTAESPAPAGAQQWLYSHPDATRSVISATGLDEISQTVEMSCPNCGLVWRFVERFSIRDWRGRP